MSEIKPALTTFGFTWEDVEAIEALIRAYEGESFHTSHFGPCEKWLRAKDLVGRIVALLPPEEDEVDETSAVGFTREDVTVLRRQANDLLAVVHPEGRTKHGAFFYDAHKEGEFYANLADRIEALLQEVD